jgi:hypothetical protein
VKIQLLLGEDGEWGSQAGRRAADRALIIHALKTSARTFCGSRSPPTEVRGQRQVACWNCGRPGHFRGSYPYGREAENDDRRQNWEERPLIGTGTREKVRMATEKQQRQRGGVASRWEMSGCRRKRGDAGIHVNAPSPLADCHHWEGRP